MTATEPGPGPATWAVTGQTPTTMPGPNGQVSHGWEVSFTVGSGGTGKVFVPAEAYTVDNVRALIAAQAETIHQVNTLTSGA